MNQAGGGCWKHALLQFVFFNFSFSVSIHFTVFIMHAIIISFLFPLKDMHFRPLADVIMRALQ